MTGFEFYAVCHSKKDSVNRGIERLGHKSYKGKYKVSLNLLTSYSQIYNQSKSELYFPKNTAKLMIDSGAYDFLIKKKAEYPYEPKEYFYNMLDLFNENIIPVNSLVSMDLICNPVLNNHEHDMNRKKIIKTVNYVYQLFKLFEKENPEFELVPVVQGYEVNEYEECVKRLIEKNVIKGNELVGIGSLANRRKVMEIKNVVKAVSDEFFNYGLKDVRLHLFGTNLNAIKDEEIAKRIASFDSFSWTYPYRFGRVRLFTGNRMIEANTNNKLDEPEFYEISLRATLEYVNFLNFRFFREKREEQLKEFQRKMLNKREIEKETRKKLSHYIKEKPKNKCKLLVFSGDQLVLLEPKNVKLSFTERYHIARSSMFQFFEIFETQKERIAKRTKELQNIKSNKTFQKDIIILDNLFDLIYQFVKRYDKNNENFSLLLEKIEKKQKEYSNLVPFIGDGFYNRNQTIIDEFISIDEKFKVRIDEFLTSLILEDQNLKNLIAS